MKATRCLSMTVSLFTLVSSGCAPFGRDEPIDGDSVMETQQELVTSNGLSINGLSINGLSINGLSINGLSINGLSINGTMLTGTASDGTPLQGSDFSTAQVTGYLSDNSTVILTIETAAPSAQDSEIWHYTLSYDSGNDTIYPCGQDPAIALTGRWEYTSGIPTGGAWIDDPTMFTFACAGSTLAKCVSAGYKPWQTITESDGDTTKTHSFRAFHQACTRMVRADYCGDGTPHTINDVPINLWDNFAIQQQEAVPSSWKQDAEWTQDGAECIKNWRYNPGSVTSDYVIQHCPERLNDDFSCFGSGSTFFTNEGFDTPLPQRPLIRNEFDYTYVNP